MRAIYLTAGKIIISLPRNNYKHYTDAMSLSVRDWNSEQSAIMNGPVSHNQPNRSMLDQPHIIPVPRMLYCRFGVIMLRLLHRLLIRFDLKVEVSHRQEFSKVIRKRRRLPNCARRLLEN